jgi:hypothetical protein
MAAVINALIDTISLDQVAVFTQDFNQVFRTARKLKAVVKEASKIMEQPIETGAVIVDHRILLPTEITLSLVLNSADYPDVYKTIQQLYLNATLLIVQTKAGIYVNQLIQTIPHEEDPSQYNAITIELNLKQVLYVTPQYNVTPTNPNNSTKVQRGVQNPTPAGSNQVSAAHSVLQWSTGNSPHV